MPEPGDPAPDFTLPSTVGELRLSNATDRGRVVLAFYYEDATPTCTTEVSMLRDDYELVRELGAEVIAVSADSLGRTKRSPSGWAACHSRSPATGISMSR